MTEYDYSPAAYERHLEKLARVEHWVTDQSYCAPAYSNPFVPRQSTVAGQSSAPQRAPPRRDVTSPHRAVTPAQGTTPVFQSKQSSSRSRSQSRAAPIRAQTQPVYHSRPYVAPQPVYTHQYTRPPAPMLPPAPPGANAVYRTYEYNPRSGKDIVLPPPRPGETYVIVPPAGRKVDVVRGNSGHSTSRSSTRSPTKKDPPLFKRLFTGMHGSNDRQAPSAQSHYRSNSGSRRERRLSY